MKKQIVSIILTLALLVGATSPVLASSSSETVPAALSSTESYSNWLRSQPASVSGDTVSKFDNLTAQEQSKFIAYLNDPQLLQTVLSDFLAFDKTNGTKSYVSGDIKITTNNTIEKPLVVQPRAAIYDYTAVYETGVDVFGIDVLTAHIEVSYEHDGDRILKIIGSDAYFERNVIPLLSPKMSDKKHWIDSQRWYAYASAIATLSFIVDGSDLQQSQKLVVCGDPLEWSTGWGE